MTEKNDQEVEETLDLPVVADEGEEDSTDWKAEATKLQQKAIRQREKTKELKAKLAEQEAKLPKEPSEKEKTNEPDYARLAFLEQRGLTNADDQKMVQDEAIRLKLPLTDVLGMEHIKSKLKISKDQREAAEGMPKGRGKAGSNLSDVDVHLAKGTTPSDLAEAEKVINARMAKEKSVSKFSDDLFVG